ncbi:hypothetical protein LWI28_024000 [Acer negundo]|uniref:WAT1-related protein n=1 Tax=Acer negundo TaxID=4023 RepID=A0AAD5NXM2_ACENE|nr:hypothetical protein LWI28_024000 [Acer negundo]
MGLKYWLVHPGVILIFVHIVFGGNPVFYKLALNDGMSMTVLVTYRLIFAAVSLAPIAFFFERGALYHNLYLAGLKLTSATFAATLYNLNPVFTYVVALFFRLETFTVKTLPGIAKVAGTATCIGGAMLFTFYKGFEINIWHSKIDLLHHNDHDHNIPDHQKANSSGMSGYHEVAGLGISLTACLCYALWIILLTKVSVHYPCFYSSTFWMSFAGSIQAFIYAICFDREWKRWKLGWDIRLLSVFYLGVLSSGVTVSVMAWCISKRGPLFVSIFNPLALLVTAVASSLVLQEKLHLGRILAEINNVKDEKVD